MTEIHEKTQIVFRFLKTQWFVVLCVLGFVCIGTLSTQGDDPVQLGVWTALFSYIALSVIFIVRFAARYQEKHKARFQSANLVAFVLFFF